MKQAGSGSEDWNLESPSHGGIFPLDDCCRRVGVVKWLNVSFGDVNWRWRAKTSGSISRNLMATFSYDPLFEMKNIYRACLFAVSLLFLPTADANAGSPELQVVSYNIRLFNPRDGADHWPNRADAVTKFIARWDVIGLQEVTPEQFVELRKRLGDEFGSYGLGRDDGKSRGESAAVFFRKSRVEVLSEDTFWLCENSQQPGKLGWDAACPRTVTWMRLKDKKSGNSFYFANTHFDHRGSQARENSAKMIVEKIGELDESEPVIVVGDFNCPPKSKPYETLVANTLSDARVSGEKTVEGPKSTWNGFREIIPGRIIDHIFVSPSVNVTEFQIHNPKTDSERFASDHLPVRIAVSW